MKKKTKTYKKHSCPENAGVHNLPPNYHVSRKDGDKTMQGIMPISDRGFKNRQDYKGQWDEESLAHEVNEYFKYCFDNDVKPAKVGVQLWLDLSRTQYYEWETGNHGFKTNILARAAAIIELSYIGRSESYPTANIFLLKSSHDHRDKSEIQVTGDNVGKDDVRERLAKMGLAPTDEDGNKEE